jgi:hypothetical protein
MSPGAIGGSKVLLGTQGCYIELQQVIKVGTEKSLLLQLIICTKGSSKGAGECF